MSNQIVACIMGQDCQDFLKICLESVKDAKRIIYVDGGSTDGSKILASAYGAEVLENTFDKTDKLANSKQRQFYLEYLKKKHMGDIVLVLDADEFVEDFNKLAQSVKDSDFSDNFICSVKMRHLMYSMALEDNTQVEHFVPNRLFRVNEDIYYPDGEHTVLQTNAATMGPRKTDATTIWHLAYASNMFATKKRYETHIAKSEVHSRDFLEKWYRAHLFGTYPVKKVNPEELPQLLLEHFHIDKDEIYFANRGLEVKHFIDAKHWIDFFKSELNPASNFHVLEWGCGRGPRVAAINTLGANAIGIEISDWAINNNVSGKQTKIIAKGDITVPIDWKDKDRPDLSIAYDVLEHLPYDKLDIAIDNLIATTNKWILVSVPVIGDPNLENDRTHIIKEHKSWWISKFEGHDLKYVPTPDHFLFKEQVLIFEKV